MQAYFFVCKGLSGVSLWERNHPGVKREKPDTEVTRYMKKKFKNARYKIQPRICRRGPAGQHCHAVCIDHATFTLKNMYRAVLFY